MERIIQVAVYRIREAVMPTQGNIHGWVWYHQREDWAKTEQFLRSPMAQLAMGEACRYEHDEEAGTGRHTARRGRKAYDDG